MSHQSHHQSHHQSRHQSDRHSRKRPAADIEKNKEIFESVRENPAGTVHEITLRAIVKYTDEYDTFRHECIESLKKHCFIWVRVRFNDDTSTCYSVTSLEQVEEVLIKILTFTVKHPGEDIPHFYRQARLHTSYKFYLLPEAPKAPEAQEGDEDDEDDEEEEDEEEDEEDEDDE